LEHWFAASCAVARVARLLAGVSNAKLYRPVSPSVPSDHDECHKKRGRKNKQKNQEIIAQRSNSLAGSLNK